VVPVVSSVVAVSSVVVSPLDVLVLVLVVPSVGVTGSVVVGTVVVVVVVVDDDDDVDVGSPVVGAVVDVSLSVVDVVDDCAPAVVDDLPSSPQAPDVMAANDRAAIRASDNGKRMA